MFPGKTFSKERSLLFFDGNYQTATRRVMAVFFIFNEKLKNRIQKEIGLQIFFFAL